MVKKKYWYSSLASSLFLAMFFVAFLSQSALDNSNMISAFVNFSFQ